MERDAEGLEDEAVLISVQPVLTCGIIRVLLLYSCERELPPENVCRIAQ